MRSLFAIGLLFLAQCSLGQNTIGLPRVLNFGKSDFHGGPQTWDIAQGENGEMFFGNNEGLLSFNGVYWKLYPLPNKTIMRSLAIGGDSIFVGGQGELGYFLPDARGYLQYHSLLPLVPERYRQFADVWDIERWNGGIYFRAMDRIFELRNQTIMVYPAVSEWLYLKQVGNRLLAQDKERGLFEFRRDAWVPLKGNSLLKNEILTGQMSPATDTIKLVSLKGNLFALVGDSLRSLPGAPKGFLKSDVYAAMPISDQATVLGTTAEGCVVVNQQGQVIQRLARSEGLQNNNVLCVYLDRNGNIWTGLNLGISCIAYSAAVKYINPNKDNGVAGFSSRIFNQYLYIASSDGAYRVSLKAQPDLSFVKGDFEPIRNSSGQAWRLDEVNQQLLMGHNTGTYLIRDNEARMISPDASWLFLPMSKVAPSPEILAGTYTGLKLLEDQQGNFRDLGNLKGTYESLRFLAMDNDGRIWASHPYRGIYLLTLAPDRKSYAARLFTDKEGLPSTLGNHVFRINNRVIFATEKGPYEFDPAQQRFIPSPYLYGLLGQTPLRYLQEDEEGNIWFCSGKQLAVIRSASLAKPREARIIYFPELTGQILSGFEAIYPYNSQNIFVAAEKGVILLNFDKYLRAKQPLGVLFSEIRAFGKTDSALFGGHADSAAQSRKIHLPYQLNSLHFEYSSPAYGMVSNIEYSFQLEGYQNEWSAWTPKTEKDYTNLPSGKYVFRVKARTNLGNESPVASYSFIVMPPWYLSIWAFGAYALLFAALVWSVNRWQQRKLQEQQRLFEEKQRQLNTLHQLELEKNEKAIIQLQNEKLANEVKFKNLELADTSLHLVERSDALAKVKEELQKLYRSSGEHPDLKKAIRMVAEMEKNSADWDKFAASFDEMNNDFLKKLRQRYPKLTNTDLKLSAYLQMNLSSKEIAQLMNTSLRGVEIGRYRLRKKLQIPTEQSIADFLNAVVKD